MIQKDSTYVVMGLLDPDSIAFAVGQVVEQWGRQGHLLPGAQDRLHKRYEYTQ